MMALYEPNHQRRKYYSTTPSSTSIVRVRCAKAVTYEQQGKKNVPTYCNRTNSLQHNRTYTFTYLSMAVYVY